jgi:hypothetical protein
METFLKTGVCPNPGCNATLKGRRFQTPHAARQHLKHPNNLQCNIIMQRLIDQESTIIRRGRRIICANTISQLQPTMFPGYQPALQQLNSTLGNVFEEVVQNQTDVDSEFPQADEVDARFPQADDLMLEAALHDVACNEVVVDENFFVCTTDQLCISNLIHLLDEMGCPDYALQHILQWCRTSRDNGFQFNSRLTTRKAYFKELYQLLEPHNIKAFLPAVISIPIIGQEDQTANVVGFDFVPKLLSLVQCPERMQMQNLNVNPLDPFDNMANTVDGDTVIGEPRTATVYQDYIAYLRAKRWLTQRTFLVELVFYTDRTHIDTKGRLTSCPVTMSSTLFKEKCRRDPDFWRELGKCNTCLRHCK